MRTWRPYLLDQPFDADTDHESLETLLRQKHCTRRLARWLDELAEYRWIAGHANSLTDGLSRRVDFEPEDSRLELRDILRDLCFDADNTTEISSYISNLCRANYEHDAKFMDQWRSKQGSKHYNVENDLLWFKTHEDVEWRLLVDLKNRIIREEHDQLTAEHPDRFRTLKALQFDPHP